MDGYDICGFCGRAFTECAYGPDTCDDRFIAATVLAYRIASRTDFDESGNLT